MLWTLPMHEMSLAEGVLQVVEETARREGAARVRLVVLEIGALSSVEPDALRFCFDAVARGGVADGAALEIDAVPGAGWCMQCAATVAMSEIYGSCPRCGSHEVQATAGTGMRVREIGIE
jgi:hydrogenase nickel incorporation protein HypA/HybF